MVLHRYRRAFIAFLVLAFPGAARPQTAPQTHAHLQLISGGGFFLAHMTTLRRVGVLFRLDPGWHIYWENPGDSGTPPKIHWDPPLVQTGPLLWPTPQRLGTGSVVDYGYQNQVVLMTTVAVQHGSSLSGPFSAEVRYVVCREICIPGEAHLTLATANGAQQAAWEQAERQLPSATPAAWRISATQNADELHLVVHGISLEQGVSFFPLDPGVIENSAPQKASAAVGGFSLSLKKSELLTKPVLTLKGLLEVPGAGTFELSVPVAAMPRSR